MRNLSRKWSNVFVLGNVIFPIIVGGFIYIAWRKDTLLVFSWLRYLGLGSFIFSFRAYLLSFYEYLPRFVLYCLPDGLWVYSLTFFMGWLWNSCSKLAFLFWASIGLVLGVGGEVGQLFGMVQGYFDFYDLLAYILAAILAIFIVKRHTFAARLWRGDAKKKEAENSCINKQENSISEGS